MIADFPPQTGTANSQMDRFLSCLGASLQRHCKSSLPKLAMARYELTEFEWKTNKPLLPDKPRRVPRVDDRRVLNGIFWILRSGSPWADLPERYGPPTTIYNRFNRWRKAGTILCVSPSAVESSTNRITITSPMITDVKERARHARGRVHREILCSARCRDGPSTRW
jgi:transposase